MNWDGIESDWQRFRGAARRQWDRLSDEQLDTIGGQRDRLTHTLEAVYGISRAASEQQVSDWMGRQFEVDHAATYPLNTKNPLLYPVRTGYAEGRDTN